MSKPTKDVTGAFDRQQEVRIDRLLDRCWEHRFEPWGEAVLEGTVSAEPRPLFEALGEPLVPFVRGQRWGGKWDCAVFRLTAIVPEQQRSRDPALRLDLGGETLVLTADGRPLQGLTTEIRIPDRRVSLRDVLPLRGLFALDGTITLLCETGANPIAPPEEPDWDDPRLGRVLRCELGAWREDVFQLYCDLEFLRDLMLDLPWDSLKRSTVRAALVRAAGLAGELRTDEVAAARIALAAELAKPAVPTTLRLTAVGHAHLDLAWLWPVRETERKLVRTVSTQLSLLERYPEHRFGMSQTWLYDRLAELRPDLYARVHRAVQEGRWELQGCTYVEMDTNLVGGESLCRQLLYGKRCFRERFGREATTLWLPDTFGFSAALPQLLVLAGVEHFLTNKLSWSQVNVFPHHTFRWRGLDGSEVLAHCTPEENYNGENRPADLRFAERNYRQKALLDEALVLFGLGDGGGGPDRLELERALRAASTEGLPRLSLGGAEAMLGRLAQHRAELPLWSGELYLEMHRGVLTTQARTKADNLAAETLARSVEGLRLLAEQVVGLPYPSRELDQAWRTILFHQFHDILPGSSIRRVYEEAEAAHRETLSSLERLATEGLEAVGTSSTSGVEPCLVVYNPLAWDRRELLAVSVPPEQTQTWTAAGAGQRLPESAVEPERGDLLVVVGLPAQTVEPLTPRPFEPDPHLTVGPDLLENSLLCARFGEHGELTSLVERGSGRELLAPGLGGNALALYEDRPNVYDAWEVDRFYLDRPPERPRLVSRRVLEKGPLRIALEQRLAIGRSEVVQEVRLGANSPRLDFVTLVEWREEHRMLRVSFPSALRHGIFHASIQFGHLQRPGHTNTSWEWARFEVPAQRWVDCSTPELGLALLNDGKYGHRLEDGVLDLALLRSPRIPDQSADLGRHRFTYALLPHQGDLVQGEVVRRAYELAHPPLVERIPAGSGGGHATVPPALFSTDCPHLCVETVKKPEQGEGIIVRMWECHGRTVEASLRCGLPLGSAAEVDLLERPRQGSTVSLVTPQSLRIGLRPFEVKTVHCTFSA